MSCESASSFIQRFGFGRLGFKEFGFGDILCPRSEIYREYSHLHYFDSSITKNVDACNWGYICHKIPNRRSAS